MRENTVVGSPKLILVKPSPNGIFFDMQDKVGITLFELDNIGFAYGGNRVSSRAHPRTVDLITAVIEDEISNDGASVRCINV